MAGLYIHIPFCHSKCAYCDFVSTPSRRYEREYVGALISELKMRIGELKGADLKTLYIGGGTPTALSKESMAYLLSALGDEIDLEKVSEFTIEANPDDVGDDLIHYLMDNGVNRISIGIQSFDDGCLRMVGRRHDADRARQALTSLSESGINYSADLIFGLPGQTVAMWEESLMELLSFKPPHLSSYLLSYEPGTRLYASLMAGKIEEAAEDEITMMYKRLVEATGVSGYRHYEISNYAMPGKESCHNSNYWNLTPYLGIGVSAHSFDGVIRRYNPSSIKCYVESLEQGKLVSVVDDEDDKARFNDLILISLRTSRGLSENDVRCRFPQFYDELCRKLCGLVSEGALGPTATGGWRIPETRWLMADSVIRDLLIVD